MLEKAVQLGYNYYYFERIKTEESLAPIRSDKRYEVILLQLQSKK